MEIGEAIHELAHAMVTADQALGHFSCLEVEALAKTLIVAGHEEAAYRVLYLHAVSGDDEAGDVHHDAYVANAQHQDASAIRDIVLAHYMALVVATT